MNKKGQTLILFIIIIPIFIILLAFVVDTGFILKENTKLNNTTKTILKTTYQNKNNYDYYDKVKNLYQKNNIEPTTIKINQNNNQVTITITTEKNSFFGKIIGIKTYQIKTTMTINENLKIEKE